MVILYSNHCPRCNIIKAKLDTVGIDYKLIDDEDWLRENGYDLMPVLEIDGEEFTTMTQMNTAIAKLTSEVKN